MAQNRFAAGPRTVPAASKPPAVPGPRPGLTLPTQPTPTPIVPREIPPSNRPTTPVTQPTPQQAGAE